MIVTKHKGRISSTGKMLSLLNSPNFFIMAGLGLVPGVSLIEKFGDNPTVGTSFEDITDIGGVYVPPTQPRIHDVSSNSAEDSGSVLSLGTMTSGGVNNRVIDKNATFITDGVSVGDFVINDSELSLGRIISIDTEIQLTVVRMANPKNGLEKGTNAIGSVYRVVTATATGASIFHIQGLDENYLGAEEFVVLNGTTAVETEKLFIRQFRARVFNSGSADGAVGVIQSTAQIDSTVSCQIIDGNNQTMMAVYSIPVNRIGYLYSWTVSIAKVTAATTANTRLRVGELSGVEYILRTKFLNSDGNSGFDAPVSGIMPGGSDIRIEASASLSADISAGFNILLFDPEVWDINI